MGNVVDYLKEYGKESFLERPFSPEDGLVLAQLSYIKFDGIVPGLFEKEAFVSFKGICRKAAGDALFADMLFAEENRKLFAAVCESRRFQTVGMNYYVNRIDLKRPSQFSAVTYLLEDGSVYIAFRGTDETLAGWREDFEMACQMPVKSQELSAEYLNLAAEKLFEKENAGKEIPALFLGGHSKGGNLAVYAAMHCRKSVQRRICAVYNLDGPGFPLYYRQTGHYERVAGRVKKIIPQSSLIGMLFEDCKAYEVVKSSSHGMMQHDAFSWIIEDGHFAEEGELDAGFKAAGEILNKWLASLTKKELFDFIEQLFALLDEAGVENVQDFRIQWKKLLRSCMKLAASADKETGHALWRIGRTLLAAIRQAALEHSVAGE